MNQKIAGSRVSPTVKAQPTANRRNLKNWELRFGLVPLVAFVGLVCGSIVVSFYFGYISGQKVGLEMAQETSLSKEPRIPLVTEDGAVSEDGATDLYAKLSEKPKAAKIADKDVARVGIDLSAVKSIDEVPTANSLPAKDSLAKDSVAKSDRSALAKTLPLSEQEGVLDESRIDHGMQRGAGDNDKKLVEALGDPTNPKATDKSERVAANGGLAGTTLGAIGEGSLGIQKGSEKIADVGTKPDLLVAKKTNVTDRDTGIKEVAKVEKPVVKDTETLAKANGSDLREEKSKDQDKSQSSTFVRKTLAKGWFAQVAAPRKIKDADDVAKRLKGSGFSVMIETAEVRGEEYFRVVVGPEETRDQAERLVTQLKREAYLKGDPFVRVVK